MSSRPFHDQTQSVTFQGCPVCNRKLDLREFEPLSEVPCPDCGTKVTVRANVGTYKLGSIAGKGGMGVVYKAFDPALHRFVALKLLRKDHSQNEKLIRELANEAVLTAAVTHANVGRVFATGSDHDRFYIVMELIEKGSLQDLMQLQGQIAEAQALDVGIQIAGGLRAAHEKGLVHRDVKPGNILFASADTAKIVDFGLALFEEDAARGSGDIWGTPYYIPPERLDGFPEDFRGDIYALGATLFHAMAGRPLFDAKNATLVALKHLKSQPASLQAFAPHVSSATAFVINRMLAKDPNARFQSYDDLINNLTYAREELLQAKPKARVVMETESDQKVLGWTVLAMLVFAVLFLGGAFAFRNQILGNKETPLRSVANAATPKQRSELPSPRLPTKESRPESSTPPPLAKGEQIKGDSEELRKTIPVDASQNGAWLYKEIGLSQSTGHAEWDPSNQSLVITTGGKDIWARDDSFYFVYQKVEGNFEVTIRVLSIDRSVTDYCKGGLMIRDDLDSNARNFMALFTSRARSYNQNRLKKGAATTDGARGNITFPQWIRMTVSGDTVTTSFSPDGIVWGKPSAVTFPRTANEYFVGIALTAHDDSGHSTTGVFDNLQLNKLE